MPLSSEFCPATPRVLSQRLTIQIIGLPGFLLGHPEDLPRRPKNIPVDPLVFPGVLVKVLSVMIHRPLCDSLQDAEEPVHRLMAHALSPALPHSPTTLTPTHTQ